MNPADPTRRDEVGVLALSVAFLLSGAAGLVYQVLWARDLALLFGSDVVATSIVLAVFMGGLALGGWLGGAAADRAKRPLVLYGALEVGIGVFGLLIDTLLASADPFLTYAYRHWFDSAPAQYQAARVLVVAVTLLPPTVLMGMTLPLIIRHVVGAKESLGRWGARFYSINTLGAVLGTIASGFFLIPAFGAHATTIVAAATNLLIGVTAVGLGLRGEAGQAPAAVDVARPEAAAAGRRGTAVLVAIGASGMAALALEVLWTRALALSFGATVYSFAVMLVCFLFGIFFGSMLVGRVVDSVKDALRLLARLELALGVSVAVVLLVLEGVPALFGALFARTVGTGSFGVSLVLMPLLVSFLVLAVPTSLLGATFAVAVRAYGDAVGKVGAAVGRVTAANTLGAILGAAGAGFVLVPHLHVKASIAVVALVFVTNGAILGRVAGPRVGATTIVGCFAVVLALAGIDIFAIDYKPILNYMQRSGEGAKVVYHAEGPSATIDLTETVSDEENGRAITSLVIGGNIEADDSLDQRRHFVLKAHLPLLFLDESAPRDVLIVGLGMGMTLRSTLGHPGVRSIQVVELSREIYDAHEHLKAITGDAVHDKRVNVRIDDGRNYLKFSDARYDMITADPIHPKVTGVGYLYTREYYRSIREHLKPGGVVCQWMPLYQLSPRSLRVAMRSFLDVFPNATFWYVKRHGLFVAKTDAAAIDYALLARKLADPFVKADLASIGIDSPEQFLALMLLGPEDVRAYVDEDKDGLLNTDDFPYLEYQAPREVFQRPYDIVADVLSFSRPRPDLIHGLPADVASRLAALCEGRRERLLADLKSSDARK